MSKCLYCQTELPEGYGMVCPSCEKNLLPYSGDCRKCKFSIPVKTILGVEYDCDRSVKRPPQSWCYVESLVS